jgi:hypothetical protein
MACVKDREEAEHPSTSNYTENHVYMRRKSKFMADLIVILVSVTAVSLIAFIGILFIGLKEAFLKRIVMALVGFASGSLISTVIVWFRGVQNLRCL